MANNKCKQCGCECAKCVNDHDVHLHVEIENLKQRLVERDNHIVTMETNFLNEANKFPNGELMALREELLTWQDKYKRLYEAHRRVQRVNQGLEDKLLKLVDVCETEKSTLTKDVASLSHKLADAKYTIKKLTEDNERYKSDVALAIQFLQCKQSNFVSQKIDSLPAEVQSQVSSYLSIKRKPEEKKVVPEVKSIKVPIPTFPPTAMVYSIPKSPNSSVKDGENETDNQPVDIVSAAIMAKVLEERERERSTIKHCDTCTCSSRNIRIVNQDSRHSIGVQTTENNNDSPSSSPINLSSNSTSHVNLADVSPGKPPGDPGAPPKGPRYCSMRLQSGSKNILLDNARSNVAPVLYTRQKSRGANSCSSGEGKGNSASSDSLQNQERVAEWVENSNEFEASSPENSKCESLRNNNERLAEMEDNVKKFLFGKSEFLKTVEIGKLKYQNMRERDGSVHNQSFKTSRSNSHTETEI